MKTFSSFYAGVLTTLGAGGGIAWGAQDAAAIMLLGSLAFIFFLLLFPKKAPPKRKTQ